MLTGTPLARAACANVTASSPCQGAHRDRSTGQVARLPVARDNTNRACGGSVGERRELRAWRGRVRPSRWHRRQPELSLPNERLARARDHHAAALQIEEHTAARPGGPIRAGRVSRGSRCAWCLTQPPRRCSGDADARHFIRAGRSRNWCRRASRCRSSAGERAPAAMAAVDARARPGSRRTRPGPRPPPPIGRPASSARRSTAGTRASGEPRFQPFDGRAARAWRRVEHGLSRPSRSTATRNCRPSWHPRSETASPSGSIVLAPSLQLRGPCRARKTSRSRPACGPVPNRRDPVDRAARATARSRSC